MNGTGSSESYRVSTVVHRGQIPVKPRCSERTSLRWREFIHHAVDCVLQLETPLDISGFFSSLGALGTARIAFAQLLKERSIEKLRLARGERS